MGTSANRGVRGWPAQHSQPRIAIPDTEATKGVRVEFAAIAVGIGALPLLTPAGPGNLAPADVALVLAVGATLLWAASTGVGLRLPYVLGVGTMVVAGTLSASVGARPGLGLLAVFPGVFLFASCL